MGSRKVVIPESVINSIASIAWFIESKVYIATAEKFTDDAYDFVHLENDILVHTFCKAPVRNLLGQKCKTFKKKYTVVFFESDHELVVCEFLPSKLIKW